MIRIGIKPTKLAAIHANKIVKHLNFLGHETTIIPINSGENQAKNEQLSKEIDSDLFLKNSTEALNNDIIDIAIHNLVDVPFELPQGIVQAAVLKRENFNDALILKNDATFFENRKATIAIKSNNQKAHWLNRYPTHDVVNVNGNLVSCLEQLEKSDWNGVILPVNGLQKLRLFPAQEFHIKLDWMIPSPAQGVLMITSLENNEDILSICKELNHDDTEICVKLERDFLQKLSCTNLDPVGALAYIKEDEVTFKAVAFSPNGDKKIEFNKTTSLEKTSQLAHFAAEYMLGKDVKKLMQEKVVVKKDHFIYSTKFITKDQSKSVNSKIGIAMSDFVETKDIRIQSKHIKKTIKNAIFTSQHAVNSLALNYSFGDLDIENIYCVGRRNKRLLERKIGYVTKVESTTKKLVDYLVNNTNESEFTYFCGNNKENELALLTDNDCNISEIECYRTVLNPVKVDDEFNGILFYSLPAIESFLINNSTQNRIAFCINETTAEEARKHFKTVITSKTQTVDSVLNCVDNYYKQS